MSDGSAPRALTLDALWSAAGSQVETAVVPLSLLMPPTGTETGTADDEVKDHLLSLQLLPPDPARKPHNKFKLTRLRACENHTAA